MQAVKIDVRNLPEVLYEIRHELVQVLRMQAGQEANPVVARRLREIAGEFEAGMAAQDARWLRQKRGISGGQ